MGARKDIHSSVRGERTLQTLGVLKAFDRGDDRVLAGAVYVEVRPPGRQLRLLFARDPELGVMVGYAARVDGEWQEIELEPYTLRSFGYYERRLRRLGTFVRHDPVQALL